jgi:transcriptional regulator with XRE-family HTH domain
VSELPIGRRVAYWRQRRKMSQQLFADQLGKSKSWVDKVERGVRRLDKFSVLYEIADVLKVDVQVLFDAEPQRKPESINCVDQVEVEEIRAAVENYDQVVAYFEPPAVDEVSLEELRKAVSHAWMSFQHAKYGVVARSLPKLLRDAQNADACYDDSTTTAVNGITRVNAAHLLAQSYQIAASVMRKLGEHEVGWLAADRAVGVSHRAGDPLLAGVATTRVANAMLALGRSHPALDLNVQVAHRLAPSGAEATPERLSVYGHLLLQGAMAAARAGDLATSRDLLRAADEAAERLGRDANHYWTVFGPTNVALHRAAAAVDLGEHGTAVRVHEELDPDGFNALLPERRAHHLVDVSRAYVQTGDLDKAAELLVEADRLAPSEIRCRPHSHEVLTGVLRRTRGTPAAPLAELADHLGVAV